MHRAATRAGRPERDDVEAARGAGAVPRPELERGRHQATPLAPADARGRAAVPDATPRAHLDEHEHAVASRITRSVSPPRIVTFAATNPEAAAFEKLPARSSNAAPTGLDRAASEKLSPARTKPRPSPGRAGAAWHNAVLVPLAPRLRALPAMTALLELAHTQHYPDAALYVVATPIGNTADITLRALHVLGLADRIAAEDTRNTGQLLARYGISKPLVAVHEHNEREAAQRVIELLRGGERVAYVSDAGTPGISDPARGSSTRCAPPASRWSCCRARARR